MGYDDRVDFATLLGKTLTKVVQSHDEITFATTDGETYKMHHEQDCCESVTVEDVIGDFGDLIGEPITLAEKVTSDTDPADYKAREYPAESMTWTFYRIATARGHVDIRWLGESNGYYSESVDFEKVS